MKPNLDVGSGTQLYQQEARSISFTIGAILAHLEVVIQQCGEEQSDMKERPGCIFLGKLKHPKSLSFIVLDMEELCGSRTSLFETYMDVVSIL